MNLDLSEEQQLLVDTVSQLFADFGGSTRARERFAPGLDRDLLTSLGRMGVLAMRSPGSETGSLSVFEALLVLEQAGRALVSLPLAETLVVLRLLGTSEDAAARAWFEKISTGTAVAGLALTPVATDSRPLIHFGADADLVVALAGDRLCLFRGGLKGAAQDHGDYRLARLNVAKADIVAELACGDDAIRVHAASVEEWKLLVAAELCGLSSASLDLAVAYAKERQAFGRPIGSYQGIAHPLADRAVDIEGARLLNWWAAWRASREAAAAPAAVSMAFAWSSRTADQTTRCALHTFGGYGLAREHDAQLFFRRAKARALMLGDPTDELARATERLHQGASAALIETGDVGIDFALDAEAEEIARETAAVLSRLMTPERRATMIDSYDGHDPEVSAALAEQGLLYPDWPREWGGRGAGPLAALAALRVWEQCGAAPHAQVVTSMVGKVVMHFGTDTLRREVLPRIASGESVCCMGYSEPGSGSDVFAAQTRASWDEDRQAWVINGQKMWTTGANLADYILILTRTEPSSKRHSGLTFFFVPMNTPGIEVFPIHTVMDERTNATFYTDVIVPDRYRVGEAGAGSAVMARALVFEQAGAYGPGDRRILPSILDWARKPDRNGGVPLDERDVRKRIAEAELVAQIGDLLSMRSAWHAGAHPDAGRTVYGPMAKHFYGHTSQHIYTDLMDLAAPDTLEGGSAPLAIVEHMHRQIQVSTVYAGTSEIQRSQIAEVFLGLPRSR